MSVSRAVFGIFGVKAGYPERLHGKNSGPVPKYCHVALSMTTNMIGVKVITVMSETLKCVGHLKMIDTTAADASNAIIPGNRA